MDTAKGGTGSAGKRAKTAVVRTLKRVDAAWVLRRILAETNPGRAHGGLPLEPWRPRKVH